MWWLKSENNSRMLIRSNFYTSSIALKGKKEGVCISGEKLKVNNDR